MLTLPRDTIASGFSFLVKALRLQHLTVKKVCFLLLFVETTNELT